MDASDVNKNYAGDIVCDLKMVNAIKSFQKEAKLQADGIAGAGTIQALKTWSPIKYTLGDRVLKIGMQGTDVAQLRKLLIEKGFIKDSPSENSILFDSQMESIILVLQKVAGLKSTGEVDKETLDYIRK